MTTTYATVEIQDALTKIGLYLNSLHSNSSNPERCEKAVNLAVETFLKFMENQQFAKESYDKVRALIHSKNNYYALLIIDQMMKNNKYAYKTGKQNCENLFKGVWERTWSQNKQSPKLQNLKLIVKVWGHIYGPKFEDNLKKWVQYTFKTKITISPEKEAELKEIYGSHEPLKNDPNLDELLRTVQDDKDQKQDKDEKDLNLLEAVLEQD